MHLLTRIALSAATASLCLVGVTPGTARADRVVVEPEVFVPHASFKFEDGYYRRNDGHYYHYDRDRDGWHYGRDHREGVRWEEKHHHHD